MKCNEFKRWLLAQGVEISNTAKGSHFKLYYGSKQTTLPDHGAKEMAEGTRRAIIKQLGLKD
ncbi:MULTISPECIES: type II toxin-antitoxin system HicA family toxin [unclassified Pseudomonas]|jgi:mRNA interferase HicA|uniref:type II toxin-antitoxin system HicA family toxin n=1 Tax=unclassified Pseudomonas TaxID=196821 RepID=UPI000D5D77D0|nr:MULTISPECIES: type II toxin-antitoxin system HicA family toxin [unclassified Pseudomonas]PVZ52562.1 mRNA interferase [Pseudomonas sp. B1(2018)]